MTKGVEKRHLQIAATFEAIRQAGDVIADLLEDMEPPNPATVYNIQLAVHEVCTNIVEHAYADGAPGAIVIDFALIASPARRLFVDICDKGKPFDPAQIAPPDLNQPQEGGYGLFLADALMDEVSYERRGDENHWRLVKAL